MRQKSAKELFFVLLLGLSFFGYFYATTYSEYTIFPKGDAKVYTLMAARFDDPASIREPLPSIYAQRIFPAFMAFLLSYPFRDEALIRGIDTPNRTQTIRALAIDALIRRAWRISNLAAYLVQLVFLYLMLSRCGVSIPVRYLMLALYSMLFIPLRLYINWIMMPDPWAFAFVAAASYFTMTMNGPGFLVSVVLGVLSKEQLLLILPTYIWRVVSKEGLRLRAVAVSTALCAVPAAMFFLLRSHPYFPSKVITPNAPAEARAAIEGSGGLISDYLFILKYHFLYRFSGGLTFFTDSAFVLIGTFAALSLFIIWHARDSLKKLLEMHYWIPFVLFTLFIGFNVTRYVIYIFPQVILVSALVLNQRYRGRDLVYMSLFLLALTAFHHDVYMLFEENSSLELTLKHQLELASDYGDFGRPLADQYRWLSVETLVAGFGGLYILDRLRRRTAVGRTMGGGRGLR